MEQLFDLLRQGVTAAHTIDYTRKALLEKGFLELPLTGAWNLEEGGKYFVKLYSSNCVAFSVGKMRDKSPAFRVAMAHSDFPAFQLKPEPIIQGEDAARFNVEIYGGMYQKSWLDRPLGVAGSVVVKGCDAFSPEVMLYKSSRSLGIIPSLAIHMDRELNKKGALDVAKELVPIAGLAKGTDLLAEIAVSLGISKEEILDYDLYLYNMDEPAAIGLDNSMLSSPRLDNLTSVGALLDGIGQAGVPERFVDVMAVFDNEEVGSRSKQGADSSLLPMVLQKIGVALGGDGYTLLEILTRSFLLSVDVAHAHHPNYGEKSDATSRAYLGKGFCIKRSVGQKYGTTADSAAVLQEICTQKNIPYTIAINKTGIPGGSTLGPIVSSYLPMPCADIGMPVLSMHSACELGAMDDYDALKRIIRAFYEW